MLNSISVELDLADNAVSVVPDKRWVRKLRGHQVGKTPDDFLFLALLQSCVILARNQTVHYTLHNIRKGGRMDSSWGAAVCACKRQVAVEERPPPMPNGAARPETPGGTPVSRTERS